MNDLVCETCGVPIRPCRVHGSGRAVENPSEEYESYEAPVHYHHTGASSGQHDALPVREVR